MNTTQTRISDRIAPVVVQGRSPADSAAALGSGTAAFVIDRGLNVLVVNSPAYALTTEGNGLSMSLGRLRARDAVLNARLERSVRDIAATGGEARLSITINGRLCTLVIIAMGAPGNAANQPAAPHALILIKEPKRDVARNVESVAQGFCLTPAETRLLGLICQGHGTVSAAKRLGVATTTARTHLARIFSKTETGRQSELVQFVATFVPSAH